jgi:hypothetical protein
MAWMGPNRATRAQRIGQAAREARAGGSNGAVFSLNSGSARLAGTPKSSRGARTSGPQAGRIGVAVLRSATLVAPLVGDHHEAAARGVIEHEAVRERALDIDRVDRRAGDDQHRLEVGARP